MISQKQKVTMADITSAGILATCLDESWARPFQLGLTSFKILDFYNPQNLQKLLLDSLKY
jgi:hypothetical protein